MSIYSICDISPKFIHGQWCKVCTIIFEKTSIDSDYITTLIKIVPCFQKVECSKIHYMNLFDVFNLDPAIAEKPQNDIDIWDII